MRDFIIKNLKKIILCSITLLIVLICIFAYLKNDSKISIKTFKNDLFTIKYDTTWKIQKNDKEHFSLKHSSDSIVNLSVTSLDEERKYDSLDSLIKEIEYKINKLNESYSLISKERTNITNKNIIGYRFLYEKENKQVLVVVTKTEDKVIIFTYYSSNNYFDLLLNSVNDIIYNFELKKEQIVLKTEINKIDNTNIEWSGDFKVDKTREYSLADNYYIVNYKLPAQFQLYQFDNTGGSFSIKKGESIKVNTDIKNYNIYEWMNVEKSGLIQYELKNLKKYYTDVKVESSKNSLYKNSYIYKITYKSYNKYSKQTNSYELVYIIYPLDYMRIFEIKIEAKDTSISSELINNINMLKKEKIASFIYRNIDNGYVVNELKKFSDYNKENYYSIKIYTPELWKEKVGTGLLNQNVYETRKFVLNCSEETLVCEYNLSYWLGNSTSDTETIIRLNSTNLVEENLKYNGIFIYNGENYERYSSEYEEKVYDLNYEKHKFYETILYKKLENDNYFVIRLNKMDTRDDSNKINEVLNFKITKEKYG